jgi:hypothetical protein
MNEGNGVCVLVTYGSKHILSPDQIVLLFGLHLRAQAPNALFVQKVLL